MSDMTTVLIVDDTPDNLALMSNILKDHYKVKVANNGKKAVEIACSSSPPDIILLDVLMPEMDGYQVCQEIKNDKVARDIPIIFLTAKYGVENEQYGLELGAVDYILKPAVPSILLSRIATHLQIKASADFLRDKSKFLEAEVNRRTLEVQAIQDITILTMASLAETRDNETGNHIRRTQHYVRLLAHELQDHPRFKEYLSDSAIDLLYKSAPLHDIGKVGIPDRILLKPGRLTIKEFEVMKTHTTLGKKSIEHAEEQMGSQIPFLIYAKEIAYAHHEKWNGSGYPEQLVGDAIPVSARLMALADVYDALISRRVYKPAMSHEDSREIILEGKGQHFDPDIVEAFLVQEDHFIEIAERFVSSEEDIRHEIERLEFLPEDKPDAS